MTYYVQNRVGVLAALFLQAIFASNLTGQSPESDSALVVTRITGRSSSVPFGAINDLGVSASLGRVYVLDGVTGEISVFGDSGDYLFHVGRIGEGPGEMSGLARNLLVLENGSFGVYDLGRQRMTMWNAAGELTDGWTVSLGEGRPLRWGASDQRLVAEVSPSPTALLSSPSSPSKLISYGLDGSDPRVVHEFRDVEPLFRTDPTGAMVMRAWAETPLWTTGSTGDIFVGRSGTYRFVEIVGPTDVLVTRDVITSPVTEEMKRRFRRGAARTSASRGQPTPGIDFPQRLPVIGSLFQTQSGEILVRVREYDEGGDTTPEGQGRIWDVFLPNGVYTHSMRLPPGFALQAVIDDLLVGSVRDQLDVPSVVILRMKSWENRSSLSGSAR